MSLEELAAKHFPFNTTCSHKRKKIIYQRESLVNDLKDWYIRAHIDTTSLNREVSVKYVPKQEEK